MWNLASRIWCFLAVQVYRTSKEVSELLTSQLSGVTRINQCTAETLEVVDVRAKEKKKIVNRDPHATKEGKA